MMAEQLAQTSKGMTSNYMVACATEWQDLYGFWENRKVMEFYFDMFWDWKVLKKDFRS